MKTEETYEQELDELIERNYYSEEWELQSAVKLYYDALRMTGQSLTELFSGS